MINMKLLISQLDSIDKIVESLGESPVWHLSLERAETGWFVFAGDSLLLYTDNKELAEVFIYGLGLGMRAISPIGYERLQQTVNKYKKLSRSD